MPRDLFEGMAAPAAPAAAVAVQPRDLFAEMAPPPQNDNFIQEDPNTGQSFFEGAHFGPVYKSDEEKAAALKAGGFTEVLKQSARDTGNMLAAPVNMLAHGGNAMMRGIITLPLEGVDAAAGTNMADSASKWLPEYRSPTDSTLENLGSNILQYAGPTNAAVKGVTGLAANAPQAIQYLSKIAAAAGAMFGVTDPESAATLGDAVGGITDIQPDDSRLMKRAKVAGEGTAVNVAADTLLAGGRQVGRMTKNFFGPEDTAAAQDTLAAFDRQKIEPPAAAIAQNTRLSNADNALSNLPMSSQRMANQRGRITGEVDPLPGNKTLPERLNEIGGGKSGSEIDAGKAIQTGSQQYADKFQNMALKRFGAFDTKMPQDSPVVPTSTRKVIEEMHPTAFGNRVADRTMNPALKSLVDDMTAPKTVNTGVLDVDGNPITKTVMDQDFYGMKLLRDKVGKMMRDPQAGIPGAELKRLYGAITDDMRTAVSTKSPALLKEFDANNAFYKSGLASIDATAGKYIEADRAGNYIKNPENVYRETMGAQNSAERATSWRKMRNQLPQDKWEVVQAEEIRNLGAPNSSNPNEFSVQTYMKKWKDLTPAEKNVLFSGQKYASMRKDLDDLAKINDSLSNVKSFKNTSNTAPQSWYMRILSGGGTGGAILGSIIGGGAPGAVIGAATEIAARTTLPYSAGRVITSPNFVRWLAEGTKQAARTPASIPAHLARLTGIAAKEQDEEIKKDILEFQKKAEEELKANPPEAVKPGADATSSKIHPRLVTALGKLESNDDPDAVGRGSSAKGKHQFIGGTWQRMVNKYGKDAPFEGGITMADRTDGEKSEYMAQKYAEGNFDELKKRIKRDPTDAEVYMAHVLGAGGAARAIKEYNTDKTAAEIFPEAAKVPGNKSLFYKEGKPKSIKDFYADMAKKLGAV